MMAEDALRALKEAIDRGEHSTGVPLLLARRVPFAAHSRSEGVPTVPKRDPVAESKLRSRRQGRAHDAVYRRTK